MADPAPWPWDSAPPARRGELHLTVTAADLDDLGHVNNVRYLAWCEAVARAHAARVGMDTPRLMALGAVPVAREHHIRYHAPAVLGDALRVRTVVTQSGGLRSERLYRIEHAGTGRLLAGCQTDWVWVDPATGRPRRIPGPILSAFGFGADASPA